MDHTFKIGLTPLMCSEPRILILGSLPSDMSIASTSSMVQSAGWTLDKLIKQWKEIFSEFGKKSTDEDSDYWGPTNILHLMQTFTRCQNVRATPEWVRRGSKGIHGSG